MYSTDGLNYKDLLIEELNKEQDKKRGQGQGSRSRS